MHVQRAVKVIEAVLLEIGIKEVVGVVVGAHSVVAYNVRVQLQLAVIVRRRCAVARSPISCVSVARDMAVLSHAVSPVCRASHNVARQESAFVEVASGAWSSDCLFS